VEAYRGMKRTIEGLLAGLKPFRGRLNMGYGRLTSAFIT